MKSQQEQKVTDGVTRQDNGSEDNITRDLAHPMRNLNVADVLISKDIKNIRRKKNDIKNFSFDGISTLPMYGTIAAAAAATSAGASTNQVSKIGEEEKTKLKPQTY